MGNYEVVFGSKLTKEIKKKGGFECYPQYVATEVNSGYSADANQNFTRCSLFCPFVISNGCFSSRPPSLILGRFRGKCRRRELKRVGDKL